MCLDCQQQAGLAAWVPFHESASAVTQLYRGEYTFIQSALYVCVYIYIYMVRG